MVQEEDSKEREELDSVHEKFPETERMLRKDNEMVELNKNGSERPEYKRLLTKDLESMFKDTPLTEETTCGWGFLRGDFLQKFANKNAFVAIFSLAICFLGAAGSYHNSIITTLEKRFKIPSKMIGLISVGNDISSVVISVFLSYYAGKGHRPRWIALGTIIYALYCILTAMPHFLYGPGEEALALTVEHGSVFDDLKTQDLLDQEKRKNLCKLDNSTVTGCDLGESSLAPQVLLFVAQIIGGAGICLMYNIGIPYMDDNIEKSKTPMLISVSFFLRHLGPSIGYAIGSICLKFYITLNLTPTITNKDPRWLGAWWLGWILFTVILAAFAVMLALFPRELPKAVVRRKIREERIRLGEKLVEEEKAQEKPSFSDMFVTLKRVWKNKIFMYNNYSTVFYFFGGMVYWVYTPKYIETQYKQSASTANMVTGSVALIFCAIGILLSGYIISKYKPSARYLAAWNVFIGAVSVVLMISYIFLGCSANEDSIVVNQPKPGEVTCNSACHCDFISYSPICGENGKTYISPCHAGCTESGVGVDNSYFNCSCILPQTSPFLNHSLESDYQENLQYGTAQPSACPINCQYEFYIFLAVMCAMKFFGASGRTSNFLLGIRCIEERDKTTAIGFGTTLLCLLAFMPSPIFFGALFDHFCILWGKTCSGNGNCWLYDNQQLRIWMNLIAAGFTAVGTLLDVGVWFYSKDLKIFDEELEDVKPDE